MSISDWVFGNVWSCLTLFIMKTSHKKGSTNRVPMLIWTINITTLKVIFKLYGDLPGPNLFWAYWSAWSWAFAILGLNDSKLISFIPQFMFCEKVKVIGNLRLLKSCKLEKYFFVTKNLENTNNILMTKKSRIKWDYKILETGRLNYSLSLFNYYIRIK